MPLGYQIDPHSQLLFIRGQGVVTQTERVQAMLAWLRDAEYVRCVDAWLDLSASESTPKLAELRELIALLARHRPDGGPRKLAIVTAKPITFGVARVFEDLMRLEAVPIDVKVFFDRDQAWEWLRPDTAPAAPR